MPRKSSIERKPEDVRAFIDKLIRQGRYTLDEIRAAVAEKHGEENVPSRSALGRYTAAQEEMLGRMREIDAAARVVVEEIGENADDRAGGLLVQSITTLATNAAMRAQLPDADGNETSIDEVRKLARAAKDVIDARTKNRKERQEIERIAREKLLKEQEGRLDAIAGERGMDEDQVDFWKKKVLGIG